MLAAALHAAWNTLLRAGTDRPWTMTAMCVAAAVVCAGLVPVVPTPARASWGCALLSALLHVGYNLCSARTHRSGDLGQNYPGARGSSPPLVSVGAAMFAGERPDAIGLAGVLLASGGILPLAFQGRRLAVDSLPYALGIGCIIGGYSVTDRVGVRLSGTPVGHRVDVPAVLRGDTGGLRGRPRRPAPDPRAAGDARGGRRRRCIAGRLRHRHRRHVVGSDGAGVGPARD